MATCLEVEAVTKRVQAPGPVLSFDKMTKRSCHQQFFWSLGSGSNNADPTGGNGRTSPWSFIRATLRTKGARCRSRMPAAGGAAWQARGECEPLCANGACGPALQRAAFPARNDQKLADADATCISIVYGFGTTRWLHTARSIMDHSRDTLMQLVQHSRSSPRLAQPARAASTLKICIVPLCRCRTASSAVLCSSPAQSYPTPGSCSGRPLSEAVAIGSSQSLPCVCISRASSAS